MVTPGVADTGVYIPRYRLGAKELGQQWQKWMGKGERAVANHDEDAVTMAVAAASRCMGDRSAADIDALFFASTTSPYKEKQSAAVIAAALDLGPMARTADFAGSLRAGTTAIIAALDAVRAGTATNVMVVASDCRIPEPGSPLEGLLGDGAAAVLISNKDLVAELVGNVSISEDFTDVWRRDEDKYVMTSDPRFSKTYGYMKNTTEVIRAMTDCASCELKDIARFAIYSPDGRSQKDIARKLKLDKGAVMEPLAGFAGLIGCAHPLLMLASALEGSKTGERVMLTSYADGSDAFIFQITERAKILAGTKDAFSESAPLGSYTKYMTFKNMIKEGAGTMTPFGSTIITQREQNLNVRHHGRKCNKCGTINTLGLRVCHHCNAKDDYTEVPLAKHGLLHTYSQEHYYPNPDGAVTMSVIDLDDGARFLAQMTDSKVEDVKIGMELELTFRRLHEGGGFHNYCWKCKPVPGGKGGD